MEQEQEPEQVEVEVLEYDEEAERKLRCKFYGPSTFGADNSMFRVQRDSDGMIIPGCFHSGLEHDEE